MAEEHTVNDTDEVDGQSTPGNQNEVVAERAPTTAATHTRTPDGRWQSTISVSFQVTSTWGEDPAYVGVSTSRRPDDPPPNQGPKAGIGIEKKSDDPPPEDGAEAGLGFQKKSGS